MPDLETTGHLPPGQLAERADLSRGRPRIALYSHDAMGIGHLRRNQLLAECFVTAIPGATVLLISGTRESGAFPLAPGVDCLTLPALRKSQDGTYGARNLLLDPTALRELRIRTLRAALASFRPDVLIVDKLPRGVLGELDQTLAELRSTHGTRIVLGLRDVLDAPGAIRTEWARTASEEVIARYYDAVWVYGDPNIYDPVSEYGFGPSVTSKLAFTGYLDPCFRTPAWPGGANSAPDSSSHPLLLCQVGGGQDGDRVADAFARAQFPPGTRGVILTGPFMPGPARRRLERLAAARRDLRVVGFTNRPEGLLRTADRVVAMGGYNTVCEALSLRKPLLVVPRVRPRSEQLLRAERFAEFRLLETLHPDRLSPEALSEWLRRDLPIPRDARDVVDFEGLQRLPSLLAELLSGGRVRGGPRTRETPNGKDAGPVPVGGIPIARRDLVPIRRAGHENETGVVSLTARMGAEGGG